MGVSTQGDDDVLSEINITPLVDVMLVLLVAFVITIPALTNAVHITLPKTVNTTPPEQQRTVTLTVDSESRVYLDDVQVAADRLEPQLQQQKTLNPNLAVHLRADERVPYGPVAKVMAALEHAGISRVSVLTDQQ